MSRSKSAREKGRVNRGGRRPNAAARYRRRGTGFHHADPRSTPCFRPVVAFKNYSFGSIDNNEIENSEVFIEQAAVKLLSRGQRTVREVAVDLNVNYHTAKNWMKRGSSVTAAVGSTKEKRPQDWTAQQELVALHETRGLSGEALQAWCRERGLFAHHLTSWRAAFCAAAKTDSCTRAIMRNSSPRNPNLPHQRTSRRIWSADCGSQCSTRVPTCKSTVVCQRHSTGRQRLRCW